MFPLFLLCIFISCWEHAFKVEEKIVEFSKSSKPWYGYRWNVHQMSIKIEHRNLEIRKTPNNFSVQVGNLLLPLSWRFWHKERGTIFLYWLFHLHPPSRVAPTTKVSTSKRKSTVSFGVQFSIHLLFQNLPKSSACFRCMTSLTLCNPVSHLRLLWHLWVTRLLWACTSVNTCFNVAPN